MQASGEALLTILNDILDFSKIEAGRLDLESIDFDLRGLVEDVASMFSQPAHAKGLELVCSVPVEMPAVLRGDPGRLRQIVTNLVGNAVKFTPSGEVVLELTMAGGDATSTIMRFQVVDTGIGIAESDQAPVFESFSQADAGTTRRYGGTGLGLAISRQLVELMGGEIGVTSEVGHGSTFWFTVPLQRGGPVPAAPPRASLLGLRILVVDDNATNRDILTRFLQSWGVRSEAADGAVAARRAIAAATLAGDPFDAALLDLNMPDIDGIELGRAIAGDTSHPPIKLVLLTSSGVAGEAERAREAGITTYLTKPVRQSQLHDCLATLLVVPPDVAPARRRRPSGRAAVASGGVVRSHPAGGGQPGEPAGGVGHAREPRVLRRHRGRRRGGRRRGHDDPLSGHPHGLPDAGDGRLRGDGADPQPPRRVESHPHRGRHRIRHAVRRPEVPGRGNGRLPLQACQAEGAGGRHGPLGARGTRPDSRAGGGGDPTRRMRGDSDGTAP